VTHFFKRVKFALILLHRGTSLLQVIQTAVQTTKKFSGSVQSVQREERLLPFSTSEKNSRDRRIASQAEALAVLAVPDTLAIE
jgi:hypothetical protein